MRHNANSHNAISHNAKMRLLPALVLLLTLCSCGDAVPERQTGQIRQNESTGQGHEQAQPENFEAYQAPAFAEAVFHADLAEGNERAKIDLSQVSQGYVGVSARSEQRVKLQVIKDDEAAYNYDIPSDGTPVIIPLSGGDGTYSFFVGEHVKEKSYAPLHVTECEVKLQDEFQPFLRPSMYVNYSQDSECVRKAAELAENAENALDVVNAVFEYICDHVTYDKEKAATVQTGYLPDLDETLATGKGICFDYAALAAGMLRSQGIPTKMVFGYVSPDDIYHAWNMFYTEETGWVAVNYEVKAGDWYRLDTTFSANGADNTFIGDGSNYADVYYY